MGAGGVRRILDVGPAPIGVALLVCAVALLLVATLVRRDPGDAD